MCNPCPRRATYHKLSHIHTGLGLDTFVTVWSWGHPLGMIQNSQGLPMLLSSSCSNPNAWDGSWPSLASRPTYGYGCLSSINNRAWAIPWPWQHVAMCGSPLYGSFLPPENRVAMLVVGKSTYLQITPGRWWEQCSSAQVRLFVTEVLRLVKMNENVHVKPLKETEKQGLKKWIG